MSVKPKQLGPNQTLVTVGDVDLYFSYETCVAFRAPGLFLVVCENVWSTTTGKLLNELRPDKKRRTGHDEFIGLLASVTDEMNTPVKSG